MDRRRPVHAAGDRVYRAIKARVVAHEFPAGQRILLQPLADELGVSTTPVRESLNRLAAEDLVIKAPQKGFIAVALSQKDLVGYHDLTRMLLTGELRGLDADARRGLAEFEPIADVLNKLNRREIHDPGVLAMYIGEIFAGMAALRGQSHVMRSIAHTNDQLYYVRMLECRRREGTQDELKRMCELLLAGWVDELLEVIDRYHSRCVERVPSLLESAENETGAS